ncbi:MAG: EpsI family protein [candidate division Zixibacteria bacterium]|nr:EpsI family protein [candidate division Zixibacteria bacterium]
MAKKTFIIFLTILVLTFSFGYVLRYAKPAGGQIANLESFPMTLGQWHGKADQVPQATIDLLDPDYLFSATYINPQGFRVQLFFDYFSSGGSSGGVHSPRNCLPGSGWAIMGSRDKAIVIDNRNIGASRFHLRLGESKQVMDFWYVTRNGETSNDFIFKIHTMLSALTLKPTDMAFIRFVALDTPGSLAALEEFEKTFVPVIYNYLTFD